MATQRVIAATKEPVHVDINHSPRLGKSNITPAVPKQVIIKLLFFTFAMIVAPIGSYFLTLNSLYSGNSTYAGATAAVVANVVLIGYVVVAFMEDQADRAEEEGGNKMTKTTTTTTITGEDETKKSK